MILSSGKMLAMGTLEELRQAADLPVTINVQGLNGSLREDSQLVKYLLDEKNGALLTVPEQDKLTILRQLLAYDSIKDLSVDSANLEQVYQYYLSRHLSDNSSSKQTTKEHS